MFADAIPEAGKGEGKNFFCLIKLGLKILIDSKWRPQRCQGCYENSVIDSMSDLKGMHECYGNTIWLAYYKCRSFHGIKFLC